MGSFCRRVSTGTHTGIQAAEFSSRPNLSRARQGLGSQYDSLRGVAARLFGVKSAAGRPNDNGPCVILKRGYDLTAEVAARLQASGLRLLDFNRLALDPPGQRRHSR